MPTRADLVRRRAAALDRYARWASTHPAPLPAHAAVEAIGTLYEMLPPESRRRPLDVSGIVRLHQLLRRISR
jgi:hypothetical protein